MKRIMLLTGILVCASLGLSSCTGVNDMRRKATEFEMETDELTEKLNSDDVDEALKSIQKKAKDAADAYENSDIKDKIDGLLNGGD